MRGSDAKRASSVEAWGEAALTTSHALEDSGAGAACSSAAARLRPLERFAADIFFVVVVLPGELVLVVAVFSAAVFSAAVFFAAVFFAAVFFAAVFFAAVFFAAVFFVAVFFLVDAVFFPDAVLLAAACLLDAVFFLAGFLAAAFARAVNVAVLALSRAPGREYWPLPAVPGGARPSGIERSLG
ncbi:MAG: hypothetical protein VX681_08730 [Myxococcota bacterium]|nr:hypothetical protein [Myxococcota bacterium]